jgi:WD40 repeat protein
VGEPTAGNVSPPDEVIVVDDARTGAERASSEPIRAGRLAGYTSDGRFLLVTKGDSASVLLDARTLKPVKAIGAGGAVAVSPRRLEAAFGHGDGSVTLLDLRTGGRKVLRGRGTAAIQAIALSPDGKLIATAAEDGGVAVWSTGGLVETFRGHSADARGLVFSPDGRTLYSVGSDGAIIAWDVSGVRRLGQTFEFTANTERVSAGSAVSPDGAWFATSPAAGRVTLWRASTLTRTPRELRGPTGPVNALAFSPHGTLLAAAGTERVVVWNVAERKISRVLPADGVDDLALAFSPNGRSVAASRIDGSDVVYDVTTGKTLATFTNAGSAGDIAFSPDGKLVASVSLDGSAAVWDVRRKREVAHLTGPVAAFSVGFSPDGKLLAVGDSSGAVVFWDVAHRRRAGRALTGNNGGITDLAFDPSGKTLVTSSDGKLRLWDVRTRKLIGAPLPGSDTGGSVAFFPDAKHVLGVFYSGAGVVWNVDPAAWKARACQVAGRNLTRVEWSDFLPERAYHDVCP